MNNCLSDSDKRQTFSVQGFFSAFVRECKLRDTVKPEAAFCKSLPEGNAMDDFDADATSGLLSEIVAADAHIKPSQGK